MKNIEVIKETKQKEQEGKRLLSYAKKSSELNKKNK